jgi:hypothetical protein
VIAILTRIARFGCHPPLVHAPKRPQPPWQFLDGFQWQPPPRDFVFRIVLNLIRLFIPQPVSFSKCDIVKLINAKNHFIYLTKVGTNSIAEEIRGGIEELIALATGEKSQESSADQMERCIWWKLLEVGRHLMQLFFAARRETAEAGRQVERDGEVYPYKGQRKREYVSVFGQVEVWRGAYWKRGSGSVYPLDEALSLPERQYSDWVQEIVSEVSVNQAYEEAVGWVQKWLPIRQPKRSAQPLVADHARLVASYYEQQTPPQPAAQDTMVVVSADGKGIPMNREHSPPLAARRGKGSKKTAKKDATVTALYTIAPYRRSADEILHALLPETMPPTCSPEQRPSPAGKQVFGTLAGKDPAFRQVVQRAVERPGCPDRWQSGPPIKG